MTYSFNNSYILDTYTIAGPYEANGPFGKTFDHTFSNLYNGEKTWEKAEIKTLKDCINNLLKKTSLTSKDIDVIISGDLSNQIAVSSYAIKDFQIPFLGIYTACATATEGIILASNMIDAKKINNAIASVSSHNMTSEKQFRNPTEYGAPKPLTSTFTATGGASILLTDKKTSIKVESGTIGKIVDYNQNNPLDMGAVMAPAAANTIYTHLKDLGRNPDYYDLILTGDLGLYGKEILIDLLKEEYDIDISKNYNDCGIMLYDLKKQKDIHAGGSGPVCSALVAYGYIMNLLKEKSLKKVLLVATGALFSPTSIFQHENILSIANAVSLEVVDDIY